MGVVIVVVAVVVVGWVWLRLWFTRVCSCVSCDAMEVVVVLWVGVLMI